jgi:hypothetical protein
MPLAFNRRSERQNFIYRHNPAQPGSFLILRLDPARGGYDPVGTYTVLDKNEDPDITQKRLINIVFLLNGRQGDSINFQNLTRQRVLYTIVSEAHEPEDEATVVFRTLDGTGVSRENALLCIKGGVINDYKRTKL